MTQQPTRYCSGCGKKIPPYVDEDNPVGYGFTPIGVFCPDCLQKAREGGGKKAVLEKYKISQEEFGWLWQWQQGKCPICLRRLNENFVVVDHNHKTGQVRGLLCSLCNVALGMLHENIGAARRLMRYLIDDRNGRLVERVNVVRSLGDLATNNKEAK